MIETMKSLIRNVDISQKQIAEKMEVKESTVSKWVNGRSTPTLQQILALSIILEVTTDRLLEALIASQDERNEKING